MKKKSHKNEEESPSSSYYLNNHYLGHPNYQYHPQLHVVKYIFP